MRNGFKYNVIIGEGTEKEKGEEGEKKMRKGKRSRRRGRGWREGRIGGTREGLDRRGNDRGDERTQTTFHRKECLSTLQQSLPIGY